MLEKTLRANRLFDFYGDLLTERQREFFRLYYREDWSLSEVASSSECSRQAVHDGLERAMERLEEYEETLSLVERFNRRRQSIRDIKKSLKEKDVDPSIISRLDSLVDGTPVRDAETE